LETDANELLADQDGVGGGKPHLVFRILIKVTRAMVAYSLQLCRISVGKPFLGIRIPDVPVLGVPAFCLRYITVSVDHLLHLSCTYSTLETSYNWAAVGLHASYVQWLPQSLLDFGLKFTDIELVRRLLFMFFSEGEMDNVGSPSRKYPHIKSPVMLLQFNYVSI
jgi:hypothetical protein